MNHTTSFKLSSQGRIASAVGIALVIPFISGTALANSIQTNNSNLGNSNSTNSITPLGYTDVLKAGNNVDVVNITNPNSKGLSHNKYNDFNVNQSGLVLNNSLKSGQSQLAGQLEANSNLNDTASVILNEVVSNNPSLLLGQQEVFGTAADYVLANPNGISCNDCGFINTNRTSLVVGTPTIEQERLSGFIVGQDQNNTLNIKGTLNVGDSNNSAGTLDLLAPRVNINGDISAPEAINVISGRADIDYDTLNITALNSNQNSQDIVLDGSMLGSMKSGQIRIHNTDSAATQTLQGVYETEGDLEVSAGNLNVVGSNINANKVSLQGQDSLYVGGILVVDTQETPETEIKLPKRVKQTTSSLGETQSFEGTSISSDVIDLSAADLAIEGSTLEGGSITATADNIDVSSAITTNTSNDFTHNKKFLWFNETENAKKTQRIYNTDLTFSGDVALNATNDINVNGTGLNGSKIALNAGNDLRVLNTVTEDSTSSINRYKNETASLKTGERTTIDTNQTVYKSSVIGDDIILTSGGNQQLQGLDIEANTIRIDSGADFILSNSKSITQKTDEEVFDYWGGLGGGETNIDNFDKTVIQGNSIKADSASINSAGNIDIVASNLDLTGDLNLNADGDLTVGYDIASEHEYKENRHGTAFNITDLKNITDRTTESLLSSDLSGNNVTLDGNNIAISSADIIATDSLELLADNSITSEVVTTSDITSTEDFDIQTVNVSQGMDYDNGFEAFARSTFEASSSLKGINNIATTGTGESTGNTLQGSNIALKAPNIDLKGNTIDASNDVTIDGDQVSTSAVNALSVIDNTTVESTGPEAYIRGGITGIEIGIGIGHDQLIDEHSEFDLVDSTISAGNDVSLTANATLTNTGTKISGVNVDLVAQDILNDTAYSLIRDRNVAAGGEAALKIFAELTPQVGASVGLYGEGVGKITETSTADTTSITATNAVNINASNTATDVGTDINANTINITANDYLGNAASNATIETTQSGNGEVSLSATTSDFQGITVAVNGEGAYQYIQDGSTSAELGNLNANDSLTIDAINQALIGQNIDANNVDINAAEVILGQNFDIQWIQASGGLFGGSVGMTFSPASCAVIPSFLIKGGYNNLDQQDMQAAPSTISGNNITVTGDDLVEVAGANIDADGNVVITGNQVNILAAQDTHVAEGINIGGTLGMAIDTSGSLGQLNLAGNLGVVNETTNTASSTNIDADNLTITANGSGDALVIEGTNITANNVNISNTDENGNVVITDAESNNDIGNFYVGANLGLQGITGGSSKGSSCSSCGGSGCGSCGGTGQSILIPTGVGAQLIVNKDNSSKLTSGSINSGNITIDSGNDVTLQGNIDVDSLTIDSGNDIIVESGQNIVDIVDVNLGISLGLDPQVLKPNISSDELLNAVVDEEETLAEILNFDLSGKSNFLVDDQRITQQTNINVNDLNTTAGNQNIIVNAANLNAINSSLNGATVTTNDNDDYVHTAGLTAEFDLINLLKSREPDSDFKDVVNFDSVREWVDEDGENTKANVSL